LTRVRSGVWLGGQVHWTAYAAHHAGRADVGGSNELGAVNPVAVWTE
jgi:hypothetical protein